MPDYILWFDQVSANSIPSVGGKNASLGELTKLGMPVPPGFAITSSAYDYFIRSNNINDFIKNQLSQINTSDLQQLETVSKSIRDRILTGQFPKDLQDAIAANYERLCNITKENNVSCAVRSSATAEDLPTASFAGQQETFLNVKGKEEILERVRECFSSIFTSRSISTEGRRDSLMT